jgi:hypothetical protein
LWICWLLGFRLLAAVSLSRYQAPWLDFNPHHGSHPKKAMHLFHGDDYIGTWCVKVSAL